MGVIAPVLAVIDGVVRTDSRDVAALFEKNHRDVLRSIDNLIEQEPSLTLRNFAQGSFLNPRGGEQEHRCFLMNRDGFALLVMGFTGAKALKWKLAYIDAFNRMEAALREAANDGDLDIADRLDAADQWRSGLALVREARIIGGRAAARRAWALAGLPEIFDDQALPQFKGFIGPYDEAIARWFAERTVVAPGFRVGTTDLFADYERWRSGRGEAAMSLSAFGKALSRMGYPSIKSDRVYRIGFRLIG